MEYADSEYDTKRDFFSIYLFLFFYMWLKVNKYQTFLNWRMPVGRFLRTLCSQREQAKRASINYNCILKV